MTTLNTINILIANIEYIIGPYYNYDKDMYADHVSVNRPESFEIQLIDWALSHATAGVYHYRDLGTDQKRRYAKDVRAFVNSTYPESLEYFERNQRLTQEKARLERENAELAQKHGEDDERVLRKVAESQRIPVEQKPAPQAIDFGDTETELDKARRELAEARVAHDLGKVDMVFVDKAQDAYTLALINC